jgi:N6-L-threonylcarbamoyladenine synthase
MSRKILGIETSCDETAVAIVDENRQILANLLHSQIAQHQPYGGVVPENAARAHLDHLAPMIQQALREAQLDFEDLDGIAVTAGPGLIGGVLVGVMMAKAICAAKDLPFIAVNHLEAHALTVRLTHDVSFPYLLLLASGGHCQFLEVTGVQEYKLLGGTIDDAAGEAFDKVARLLGLDYPGGPAVEKLARSGDPFRYDLPRPLKGRKGCDLSFAGLKTAVRTLIDKGHVKTKQDKADLAASFQRAVGDCLVDKAQEAFGALSQPVETFVIAGGVAANEYLRLRLAEICATHDVTMVAPPLALCTDNAAMVAWAGLEALRLGRISTLNFAPRPRWPLAA